jgi:hypothetical protein
MNFWIATPGGGAFNISVSTNGGPWSAPLLRLDGYSPTPAGHYTNLALARQFYRLRLDGVAGTNAILGPQYLDSASTGVNVAFMTQEGANLDQLFALSTNVLYPIFSALNPQLVVWHLYASVLTRLAPLDPGAKLRRRWLFPFLHQPEHRQPVLPPESYRELIPAKD